MIQIEALAFRQWEPPNVSDISGRARLNIVDSVTVLFLARRIGACLAYMIISRIHAHYLMGRH